MRTCSWRALQGARTGWAALSVARRLAGADLVSGFVDHAGAQRCANEQGEPDVGMARTPMTGPTLLLLDDSLPGVSHRCWWPPIPRRGAGTQARRHVPCWWPSKTAFWLRADRVITLKAQTPRTPTDRLASAMIITSLLDRPNLYKFTMMQVVLHQFPVPRWSTASKCRNPGVDLAAHAADIH